MSARGITMIDAIQGPPRWNGPDVLLRQTSFRALAEERLFREADGSVAPGALRVRFGEVEARGLALTGAGRDRYDAMLAEVDRRLAAGDGDRQEVAAAVWSERLPSTELGLLREGLGYFTFSATGNTRPAGEQLEPADLVETGVLTATPIVYEDFLPRSAAGIFQSNLTDEGSRDDALDGTRRDAGWLSDVMGIAVADPLELYAVQQQRSLAAALS
jgi:uncharacterized glyoxalase superfamily metalloenzyme YdcJ